MSDAGDTLTVEVCSGPLDGAGVTVRGGSFTVGHGDGADVSLPQTPGTPEKATIRYSLTTGGGVSLEADCDLEHDGSQKRAAASDGGALVVRIGATDLAVAAGGGGEEPPSAGRPDDDEPGSGESGSGDKPACPNCGAEHPPGARWCPGCGRTL